MGFFKNAVNDIIEDEKKRFYHGGELEEKKYVSLSGVLEDQLGEETGKRIVKELEDDKSPRKYSELEKLAVDKANLGEEQAKEVASLFEEKYDPLSSMLEE